MRTLACCLSSLSLVLLVGGNLRAETITRSIDDVAYINDGEGAVRVLFRIPNAIPEGRVAIGTAVLTIPLAAPYAEKEVHLQAHPILTDWSAGSVQWNSGWERPGGDFHPEIYARAIVHCDRSPQRVSFDVTSLLNAQLDGLETHGIILTVAPYQGLGLRANSQTAMLSRLGQATLEVTYRHLPEPPPSVRR
jgi:hypothetical protein